MAVGSWALGTIRLAATAEEKAEIFLLLHGYYLLNGEWSSAMIDELAAGKLGSLPVEREATRSADTSAAFDRVLVRDALAGDLEAFEELHTHYYEKMAAIAYNRLSNKNLVPDVLVEVFFRAHKYLETFEPSGTFAAWLTQITINECSRIERQPRWRSHEDSIEQERASGHEHPAAEPSPEAQSIRKEGWDLLWRTVDDLPKQQRDTIILRYREGLSYKEIAERLGCPLSTVGVRINRALERLYNKRRAYE